jgi:hypothetical protein
MFTEVHGPKAEKAPEKFAISVPGNCNLFGKLRKREFKKRSTYANLTTHENCSQLQNTKKSK